VAFNMDHHPPNKSRNAAILVANDGFRGRGGLRVASVLPNYKKKNIKVFFVNWPLAKLKANSVPTRSSHDLCLATPFTTTLNACLYIYIYIFFLFSI
jgi:hypothetical protein